MPWSADAGGAMTAPGVVRTGATLVEVVVALVLGAVVASAIARSRGSSATGASGTLARADARRQLRAGEGVLPATLHALAPAAGDLLALDDTALEFHGTLGATVLCALETPPAPLPGASSPRGIARLLQPDTSLPAASWIDTPDAGDALLVLDPAGASWHRLLLRADARPGTGDCLGSVRRVLRVAVDGPVVPAVADLPARVQRRARWTTYRASDGRWYLGFRDARAGVLEVVQPVAGPYDDAGARGWSSTVRFRYLDSAGAPTVDARLVARVDVTLASAPAARGVAHARRDARFAAESLLLSVGLRNAGAP